MSTILGLFQSTLSVRRATDPAAHVTAVKPISIHALREESDLTIDDPDAPEIISIHALREESDAPMVPFCANRANFNPRSP